MLLLGAWSHLPHSRIVCVCVQAFKAGTKIDAVEAGVEKNVQLQPGATAIAFIAPDDDDGVNPKYILLAEAAKRERAR